MKRNGYRVDIYPWVGWANESVYFDTAIADNLKREDSNSRTRRRHFWTEKTIRELARLEDLALFRGAPHFVKPYIYNNQRWFLIQIISEYVPDRYKAIFSRDDPFETSVFAERADRAVSANRKDRVFKYYHLKGTHPPLTVTQELRLSATPVPFNYENYVLQLEASLEGLGKFFAALKRANVYDQTLIMIVGDHGSGMAEGLYLNSSIGAKPKGMVPGTPGFRGNFRKDKARGVPLVLIKRLGARGPMQQKPECPVSLLDVPKTIAAEMGIETAAGGISMFQAASQLNRARRYGAIEMTAYKTSHVGTITIYKVTGNSWEDRSWSFSRAFTARSGEYSARK